MVFGFILRITSLIGSFPVYLVAAFLLYFGTITFIQLIIAFILTSIVIWFLRLFITAKRPDTHSMEHTIISKYGRGVAKKFMEHYKEIESRSFASSHVARIIAFGYLAYLVDPIIETIIVFGGLAVIIGIARLALKRHRFFDVVVGAIIGMAVGFASVYLHQIFF